MRVGSGVPWLTDGTSAGLWAKCTLQQLTGARRWDFGQKLLQHPAALVACACSHMPPPTESMMRSARAIVPERQNIAKTLVKAGFPGKARFYESSWLPRCRLLGRSMMPHCREGAMSVSQTNFHDHLVRGAGYFGTLRCRNCTARRLRIPDLSIPTGERRRVNSSGAR
jgi:hypothetical protein